MSPRFRRAIGLTAVPALALSTLAALPSTPAYAAEPDPAPVAAGAAWLADQVTDGLVHNDQFNFDDYGLSIDVALGLDAVGGQDATVQAVADAIATNLEFYIGYDYFPAPPAGETRHVLAGSIAKALVLAQTAGRDPAAYGGHDLVADLEAQVVDAGPAIGRIRDTFNPDVEFESDFSNTFGQTFAVRGLDAAGSPVAEAATEFLIAQQCDEGFFRQDFAAIDAADQTCDGDAAAEPSTDVTALAVLALQGQADDTDVQAVIDGATAWLLDEQNPNGSFGSSSEITTANTNSTGLAGWALGVEEQTAAAERAAGWVRGHQADDPAPCATELVSEVGAVAYDAAAQQAGRTDGITVELQDQWRRATSQALPVLQWAPLTGTGGIQEIDTAGYFRAGTRVTVGADGFPPGDTVCFTRAGAGVALAAVGHNGQALARVLLPQGSGLRTFNSNNGQSEGQPMSFHALGAKTLRFEARDRVPRGKRQVVKLRGLAPGERYKVKYRGKRVDTGIATAEGRATERFRVGRKLGKAKVLVVGEFGNRRGAKTFRVVR